MVELPAAAEALLVLLWAAALFPDCRYSAQRNSAHSSPWLSSKLIVMSSGRTFLTADKHHCAQLAIGGENTIAFPGNPSTHHTFLDSSAICSMAHFMQMRLGLRAASGGYMIATPQTQQSSKT